MSIVINSPSSSASVSGTVVVAGQTVQTIQGQSLSAQAFAVSFDTTLLADGLQTLSVANGAGETASVPVLVGNVNVHAPSPDGAYTGGLSDIYDSYGVAWHIGTDRKIYRNSNVDTATSVVTVLYYKNNAVYQQNTALNWYKWSGSAVGAWSQVTDPRPYAPFYGLNMHPDYSWSAGEMVARCQQVGAKTIRMNTMGTSHVTQAAAFRNAVKAIDPSMEFVVVIDRGPNWAANESANYASGFSVGAQMAAAFPPDFIQYECGNEMYTQSAVFPNPGATGNQTSHYSNSAWPALRGHQRGMIDGVKSVNPLARCSMNFTILQTTALDMIWNGKQPNGTSGYPKCKTDCITWHNYRVYGSLITQGVLSAAAAITGGRPVRITEWNSNPEDGDASASSYMVTFMSAIHANRVNLKIEGIDYYQADGGSADFGLFYFPQKTQTYTNFVSAHPV